MPKESFFLSKERGWLSPLIFLSNNLLSLIGVVLVTTSSVLWLFLLPATVETKIDHPYLGILAFLILPGAFFLGLALIPAGMFLQLRKKRRLGKLPETLPPVSLRNPQLRRLLLFVGITTCVNIVIGGQVSYRAVTYLDSVTFCGKTCHTVMQPEYTAYQNSPHSRVECVGCHIGPGASWFVKSKLAGVRQVFATVFDTYPRPIPVPVMNLRPARETCEQCHWPQKFGADRLRIIPKFETDKNNTETKTVLLMRIGGGGEPGIHGAHLGNGVLIRYAPADRERQTIPWVEISHNGGPTTTFTVKDAKPEEIAKLPVRVMDCIDCHNRPTHTFELPNRALNRALADGEVPALLPWVKKAGLEILQKPYPSRRQAEAQIPRELKKYYRDHQPDLYRRNQQEIERAAQGLIKIYSRNIFPAMKVSWGTYPNNLGHTDFPGCFRCHDDGHADAKGNTIPQDCSICHELLAMDAAKPEILTTLGLTN